MSIPRLFNIMAGAGATAHMRAGDINILSGGADYTFAQAKSSTRNIFEVNHRLADGSDP